MTNIIFSGFLIALLLTVGSSYPSQDYDYGDYGDGNKTGKDYDEDGSVDEGIPVFVENSQEVTVKEGDPVELSCKTIQTTDDVLIFRKVVNESTILIFVGDISLDEKGFGFTHDQKVFKKEKVSRKDAGTYVCLYQRSVPIKLVYTLNVLYPPTIHAKKPSKRVDMGSDVTMECIAKGNPQPEITWTKVEGKFASGVVEEKGVSVTLGDVDRHVEGTYNCSADNGVGDISWDLVKVLVDYPPEINTERSIIRTGAGDKVELVCIVHSRPAAKVFWTRDGVGLPLDNVLTETEKGHRYAITISDVSETQYGAYECHAKNDKGEATAAINLTDIPKKPHFTSPASGAEEKSYTVVWETESYYPITEFVLKYKPSESQDVEGEMGDWMVIRKQVNSGKDSVNPRKLMNTIDQLSPATEYDVVVKVKNTEKWSEESEFTFTTRRETAEWHTAGCGTVNVNVALVTGTMMALLFKITME